VVAALPPSDAHLLPLAVRELCNGSDVAAARTLFAGAVERHPQMRELAARALEQAEVCAAERDADGAAAREWFARAARR
jgi:hypothetical protein